MYVVMMNRLEWYNEAKLGLFVHWGPYSVAGVDASWPIMVPALSFLTGSGRISERRYASLPSDFNPVKFDADSWVKTIQDAGFRYLVFTAKHHDGFCMFDAPGTEYKITNTPFRRDIVSELASACANAGLRFGLYYSPPDMHHPGYRDTRKPATQNWYGEPDRPEWSEYLSYMEEQLRVLLTDYGKISVVWFDGLFGFEKYQPARFHDLISSIDPDILVNNRLGEPYDFVTPEQGLPEGVPINDSVVERKEFTAQDFIKLAGVLKKPILRRIARRKVYQNAREGKSIFPVPTEENPNLDRFQPWETCITMGRTWGYNPNETDWKSADILIRVIVAAVCRGGNVLMNVGPKPDGEFPVEATERLAAIGEWLNTYGETLRGSTYGAIRRGPGIASFRKGATNYLVVTERPESGTVQFAFDEIVAGVKRIDTGEELPTRVVDGKVEVPLSASDMRYPIVLELMG